MTPAQFYKLSERSSKQIELENYRFGLIALYLHNAHCKPSDRIKDPLKFFQSEKKVDPKLAAKIKKEQMILNAQIYNQSRKKKENG